MDNNQKVLSIISIWFAECTSIFKGSSSVYFGYDKQFNQYVAVYKHNDEKEHNGISFVLDLKSSMAYYQIEITV